MMTKLGRKSVYLGAGALLFLNLWGKEPVGGDVILGEEEKEAPQKQVQEKASAGKKSDAPLSLELRGRLVCLAEEMRERYGANVPPVHDHLLGLRVEEEARAGGPAYYTILRTPISEGLFGDERFQKHTLVLSGRRFPDTAVYEVTSCRWLRDAKLYDVYYWCGVCAIKGFSPGPCACCRGKVELREALVEK